jgi:branched-chain amino acid transport system substrate-binding protein
MTIAEQLHLLGKGTTVSRKVLIAVACLAVVAIAAYLYLRNREEITPQDSRAVTVGIVLPLSGSMAEYGGNGRDGLVLAKEQLAQQGIHVNLLTQDTKEAPEGTVSAVRRLIDVDQVKYIIGGLTSGGVLAAAPYAQTKGVLFFSPAASAPGIPEIGDMIFRNWQSDTVLAEKFGEAAYQKLGLKNVAILHVSNEYGNTNAETFAKSFKAQGGNVALTRAFPQGASNFRDLVTTIKAQGGLDSLLLVGYPDEYRGLFDEIQQQGVKGLQILATDTFYTPSAPLDFGSAAEGVVCAVASKPGDDYEPRRRFADAYKKRFNKEPGLVSDTAYDALMLLVQAIQQTDGSPKSVSQHLLQIRDYQGAAGSTTFTETGDFKGGIALFRLSQGKFVPVGL